MITEKGITDFILGNYLVKIPECSDSMPDNELIDFIDDHKISEHEFAVPESLYKNICEDIGSLRYFLESNGVIISK